MYSRYIKYIFCKKKRKKKKSAVTLAKVSKYIRKPVLSSSHALTLVHSTHPCCFIDTDRIVSGQLVLLIVCVGARRQPPG